MPVLHECHRRELKRQLDLFEVALRINTFATLALFGFERRQHERQGCEYFGLDLHLIVSPLEMPPAIGTNMGNSANHRLD